VAVTFILGRAGTGKTRCCLNALTAESAKPDDAGRLLFLVPEQSSFQMERELALRAPRQGYWRAEVLSFSRLTRRVFDELGRDPHTLRNSARALALRSAAAESPEDFQAFGAAANTPGFFKQLDRFLEELFAENVTPEEFQQAGERVEDAALRRRVEALARIYRRYMQWLGSDRLDPALRLVALRERLTELPWLNRAKIWVDGFAGFTGQELETLTMLARRAREVSITLLLDPRAPVVARPRAAVDELSLFHRTATTYQRLTQRLAEAGVDVRSPKLLSPRVSPRFKAAPLLAELESGLATPSDTTSIMRQKEAFERSRSATSQGAGADQVRLIECETHLEEIRAAAGFVRERVRLSRGRLRYRDFAVIARDLTPIADTISDLFSEYDIPHFVDRRRSLGAHALARFIHAVMEALACDFSTASARRLLRGGLAPLTREHAEILENIVAINEIRGFELWRREHWKYEWSPRIAPDEAALLDTGRLRIARALAPLVELSRRDSPPAGADWALALNAALAELGTPDRLAYWITQARLAGDLETAEMHRLAWDSWRQVLEDLHEVLGARPLSLSEATSVVAETLSEATVGLAPPTLDQVLISSIERSRHPDVKYAWVMAFNEGIFPATPAADVLLRSSERDMLTQAGLPAPRPRRDDVFAERMLAYIALTRASHGLTISYARTGADGSPRVASPLLHDVRRILPGIVGEEIERTRPPVCLAEFARGRLAARSTKHGDDDLSRRYEALYAELSEDHATTERLDRMDRGFDYDNSTRRAPDYARKTDSGAAWNASHSEVNMYLRCPFQHFAAYALNLRNSPRAASIPRVLGLRAHEILAAATNRAIQDPRSASEISDQEWASFLDDALRDDQQRRSRDFDRRRPQLAFLARIQRTFLNDVLLAHAARWRRGKFEPMACERRFDRRQSDALDALELKTAAGEIVRLHGFIDRIDRGRVGGRNRLLVYDYKSSAKTFGEGYLTQDRLQLMIYLSAVRQAFGDEGDACCAGVLVAPLHPTPKAADAKAAVNWTGEIARMHMYRPRGLFDMDAAKMLDRELGRENSPVAAMQLKKDGAFNPNTSRDVVSAADLTERMRLAEATVLQAAAGVISGEIGVAPLVEKKILACHTCEYAGLCRFDPIFNKPRLAEATLPVLNKKQRAATGEDE